MNKSIYQEFINAYGELKYYSDKAYFSSTNLAIDDIIDTFNNKITPYLAQLSDEDLLEEYRSFQQIFKRQLLDSLEIKDYELYNQTLKRIKDFTQIVLQSIDDSLTQ